MGVVRIEMLCDFFEDEENNIIDVFVELDNDSTYTVTLVAAKTIECLMGEEKLNYFEAGYPCIIVKELTQEIIEKAVTAYAEDNNGYWLKLYHFARYRYINKTVFDE